MIFIFQFVKMVYHIDFFVNIEESLHLRIKPTRSCCMTILMCCWISVRILLRISESMFISDVGL